MDKKKAQSQVDGEEQLAESRWCFDAPPPPSVFPCHCLFAALLRLSSRLIENCALPGYYVAGSDNFLPTFRYNPSVSSSGFLDCWSLRKEPIGCPETSLRNYHYSLRNKTEERSSQFIRGGSLKSRIVFKLFGCGRRVSGNQFQKFKIRLNF